MPNSRSTAQASSTDQDGLVDALVQAVFVTMAVLNKVAAENDLSLTQLRVLAILRDRRPGMTALADYLGLDKSSMTGLVGRAEKRGLLRRVPSGTDRRSVDVALTPDGAKLAEHGQAEIARSLSTVTDRLSAADRRKLQALLEQMLGLAQ